MNRMLPILFLCAYFSAAYPVIWCLVMLLNKADPKFSAAVGLYYWVWVAFFFPPAAFGAIATTRLGTKIRTRLLLATASLAVVLLGMFLSFYCDIGLVTLAIEYVAFAVFFFFMTRIFPAKRSELLHNGACT